LQSIVAHCAAVRHGKNKLCNNDTANKDDNFISFAYDLKYSMKPTDRFAIKMSLWIFSMFNENPLKDTDLLLKTLKAYRSTDTAQFTSCLGELDEVYDSGKSGWRCGTAPLRWSLCRSLATLALEDQNAEMLKAILDMHDHQFEWEFNRTFDNYKHEGGNPEIIRIVEESGYTSPVPLGKRFSDLHPLDYLM